MSRFISACPALQDYQMQLMLLEQQNKKRLLQARAKQDSASRSTQGFASSSHPDVSPSRISCSTVEEASNRARQRQSGNPGVPTMIPYQFPARQDYQMQLMLLEQQNKKRLLQARAEHDSASRPTQGSTSSSHPNVPPGRISCSTVEGASDRARQRQSGNPGVPTMKSYQSPTRQDYQMQLMLLEQQNKKRLLQAQVEQDFASRSTQGFASSSHPDVPSSRISCSTVEGASDRARQRQSGNPSVPTMILYQSPTRQDYQMQLTLLEQQNKKRLLQARVEQANASSSAVQSTQEFAGSRQPYVSRDYSSTRAAQYTTNWAGHRHPMNASAPAIASNQNPAKQTLYNDQLMLLEQQNKARLLEARARQHVTFAPVVLHTQGFSETSQSPVTLAPAVVPQYPARKLQS
jgi:hypothetical protein